MANQANENPPENSLSESWATLSNSDYSREDDLRSEITDVGSLLSNNGPDDVRSVQDDDAGSEAEHPASICNDDPLQEPPSQPHETNRVLDSEHGSTLTLRNSQLEAIEFEEPERWPEAGQVDLKHTIDIFNESETSVIMDSIQHTGLKATQLVGTIRMTMSKTSLDLERPFRLLYVGDPQARPDILAKIGDVLVAGTGSGIDHQKMESSRYHVIPASFGPRATSNYADLVPIQTQIVVDECTSTSTRRQENGPDQIILSLKNGSTHISRWTGTGFEIASGLQWSPPDVAIFYTSRHDEPTTKQTHQLANAFMFRHSVPSMMISEERGWKAQYDGLRMDLQSLHFCLETRATSTQESRILRRLPIDFETFESLDSEQLNKNLACLTNAARVRAPRVTTHTPPSLGKRENIRLPKSSEDVEKNLTKSTMVQGRNLPAVDVTSIARQFAILVLTLIISGFIYTSVMFSLPYFAERSGLPTPAPSTSTHNIHLAGPILTMSAETPVSKPIASVTHIVETPMSLPKGLATIQGGSDLAAILSHHAIETANKSENFRVQVIGDCHMIVKAPEKLRSKRKAPNIKVSVARGDVVLNSSFSKLFDGVYTIKIDRGDAYGPLNVTVRATKPAICEEHEVDFGNQWLKVAGWKKAAEIVAEQFRLDFERLSNHVHVKVEDASRIAALQARKFAADATEHIRKQCQVLTQEARQALNKSSASALSRFQASARTVNAQGSAAMRNIAIGFERLGNADKLQWVASQLKSLSELPDKFSSGLPRTDVLAKAQQRAQRVVKNSSKHARKQYRKFTKKRSGGQRGRKGHCSNR